ncbi:MAG: NAD(P)H-hydrate epimerase [Candidatus Promineifilaceae bacterium]|nr:NAD(P)H-hydrate epimerase [Candidatus Promineifilaceae bacterium]
MDLYHHADNIPNLTTAQMIEVDRAMIEDYGIALIQMMENAGRNLAHLARIRFLDGDPRGKKVVILAGSGGNGGGALGSARRLSNWGAEVHVILSRPREKFTPVPKQQLAILQRMNLFIEEAANLDNELSCDLVIDGIIGYSLKEAPRGSAGSMIRWANAQTAPILALDAPSGLDTATGTIFDPAINAAATMTLALPKVGLTAAHATKWVGELYLADISVPPQLYAEPALQLSVEPIFAANEIVRLR